MRTGEVLLTDESGNTVIKAYHSVLPPQKRVYQAHHHTECELSFFLRGSGIYRLSDREYPFHPGDIFLFGSNEAHCITELYEDMDLLNFQFEPRILWEDLECGPILNMFTARSKNFSNRFPAGDEILLQKLSCTECLAKLNHIFNMYFFYSFCTSKYFLYRIKQNSFFKHYI